jgi:hypothetical protein
VNGSTGVDIFKNSYIFILVQNLGRQFMGNNVAEYAGHPFPPGKIVSLRKNFYKKG